MIFTEYVLWLSPSWHYLLVTFAFLYVSWVPWVCPPHHNYWCWKHCCPSYGTLWYDCWITPMGHFRHIYIYIILTLMPKFQRVALVLGPLGMPPPPPPPPPMPPHPPPLPPHPPTHTHTHTPTHTHFCSILLYSWFNMSCEVGGSYDHCFVLVLLVSQDKAKNRSALYSSLWRTFDVSGLQM